MGGLWPEKILTVGCAILLAGTLTQAHASTTAKKSAKTAVTSSRSSGSTKSAAVKTSSKGKKSRKKTASWRRRGQQKIDSNRAREIQTALIREHYLNGKASGVWDDTSQKAMERYQADNGWQSKMIPDSRALIKLGLGPDHEHLLNPETAMTSAPAADAASSKQISGSNPPQR